MKDIVHTALRFRKPNGDTPPQYNEVNRDKFMVVHKQQTDLIDWKVILKMLSSFMLFYVPVKAFYASTKSLRFNEKLFVELTKVTLKHDFG